jgi:tellurite resistance protein TehA-like permease
MNVRPKSSAMRRGPRRGWLPRLLGGEIAVLNPGYFALVMATGIISNAMFFTGHHGVSNALFALNAVFLVWLIAATIWRALGYRAALWRDLVNPRRVFSFFTIVAALDVFGGGLCLRGEGGIAVFIWFTAFALWFVLLYFSFGVLAIRNKEDEANVIHGGWLIAIVGTESLVILGSQISPWLGGHAAAMSVLTHMLWGVGLGLYGIFITLFAHRMFFFRVEPSDLSPLLWVVMGAGAIATNAGSVLILTETTLPFLQSVRPFIDGATLLMWAWSAWLIPLLVMLDIWKHAVRGIPFAYTPMLWSFVFPLGMFALASGRLSLASDFTPLSAVAYTMVWIALAAWLVTAIGLAGAISRSVTAARSA